MTKVCDKAEMYWAFFSPFKKTKQTKEHFYGLMVT